MRRILKLRNYKITKLQNRSRGYILITLMLFLSLLAVAALAVLPDLVFQIQRDREEELIHRGLGYARGVRRFYKKFGRYPARIEELENTNNLRFIRKHYKDPINKNQEFRILRMGDVVGLGTGQIPMAGQGLQAQLGGQNALGGIQSQSGIGSNPAGQQTQVTNTGTTNTTGADSSNPSDTQTGSSGSSSSSSSGDTSSSTQQVFGGGPILGVVSVNQGQTIREFCKKNHYKDWYFIYDPTGDRGGAITTPWCPGQFNQGLGMPPPPNPGTPSPPGMGAPGTVSPTPNPPNPGTETPPEQ